jgi:hypothetical protein
MPHRRALSLLDEGRRSVLRGGPAADQVQGIAVAKSISTRTLLRDDLMAEREDHRRGEVALSRRAAPAHRDALERHLGSLCPRGEGVGAGAAEVMPTFAASSLRLDRRGGPHPEDPARPLSPLPPTILVSTPVARRRSWTATGPRSPSDRLEGLPAAAVDGDFRPEPFLRRAPSPSPPWRGWSEVGLGGQPSISGPAH